MSLLDNFFSSGHTFTLKEKETAFKFKAFNIALVTAFLVSLVYASIFKIQHLYEAYYMAEKNLLFAFLILLFLIFLRRNVNYYKILLSLFFVTLFLVLAHLLFVEIDNTSRYFWFVLPIIMAYYLYNSKVAIFLTFSVLLLFVFYAFQTFMPYPDSHFALFDAGMIIGLISVVLAIFQKDYAFTMNRLERHKKDLEKHNSHLDDVAKSEHESNAKKTSLIIEESRFAQMGKLLSMIAHHWRQPLSSISTSSANIKMSIMLDDLEEEKLLHNIESIDYHVRLLSDTINDFRSYFKTSKEKEVLSGQDIMRDAFNIIQETMSSNGIMFELDLKDESQVLVYKNEMAQAVLNILTNANEIYLINEQQDARMLISVSHDDEDMIINIEDNAGGVEVDELSRLFEPYYSTKLLRNGTGLGLYISKTIVEEQALGDLSVRETEKGLCFTLRIPRHIPTNS